METNLPENKVAEALEEISIKPTTSISSEKQKYAEYILAYLHSEDYARFSSAACLVQDENSDEDLC